MKVFSLIAAFLFATHAFAQEPLIKMELSEPSAIPGQPIVLRVSVLVPTFMTSPPEFPSFEVPNVMVRLPERASGPISETVEGETWSGVGRSYRLYPMTAGQFEITAQPLTITWSDPDTAQPLRTELMTQAVTINGIIPEMAADLSPFLGAKAIALDQVLDGDTLDLKPGDSFARRVTVSIKGTTPYAVPPILLDQDTPGLAQYPKDPAITESEDRGVLSGTRLEEVVYVAEIAGRYSLPPAELKWFNIETQDIEILKLEGVDIAVSGAPSQEPADAFDWRTLALIAAAGVVAVCLAVLFRRYCWPFVKRAIQAAHHRWEDSELYAFRALRSAVRQRDINATMRAYERWEDRLGGEPAGTSHDVESSFARITAERYGIASTGEDAAHWRQLDSALRVMRKTGRASSHRTAAHLSPLNPTG